MAGVRVKSLDTHFSRKSLDKKSLEKVWRKSLDTHVSIPRKVSRKSQDSKKVRTPIKKVRKKDKKVRTPIKKSEKKVRTPMNIDD